MGKLWPAVGIFISLVGYYALAWLVYFLLARGGVDFSSPWTGALPYTAVQAAGFLALLYVAKREGGGFKSIYFGRLGRREAALALLLWFVAFTAWLPINAATTALGLPQTRWGYSVEGLNAVAVFIWAVGAAFFEEAFFRGYALTRLPLFLRGRALPAAINVLAFAGIHLRFGLSLFVYMLAWASVVTVLFYLTRSTWACFLYHCVNNLVVDFVIYG
ncbi:MAG: CPBP family intramembrane glutamic endopeptidase [Pyrobaculum sp.]